MVPLSTETPVRILILYGGDSPEREVSLRSGSAVADALRTAGYAVTMYDPKLGHNGLLVAVAAVDIVFPILHGVNGEDGVIQKELEDIGVPFLGSDSNVSRICFDKISTHRILEASGILMPSYSTVSLDNLGHELFMKPFVLKPIHGGSSLDTLIARTIDMETSEMAHRLLEKYPHMLLEELISGQEITVPILDNTTLPVIAIVPPDESEFDYENKYNGKSKEICPVPSDMVSKSLCAKASEIALQVHAILGARHLSRVDMIVDPTGKIHTLEINTMPGMTDRSLMPIAAMASGMDMPKFTTRLVDLVIGGN